MRNTDNIFDLVERAAARDRIPPLQLWQETARALIENDLAALNLSDLVNPAAAPALTFEKWLPEFHAAVDRYNDPHRMARILKCIIVLKADFDRWLRKAGKLRRGPTRGVTGLGAVDRKAFPRIAQLMKAGKARSPYGAALILARDNKLAGGGTPESRAKRVAKRYRASGRATC
jgi:hypothetical protein